MVLLIGIGLILFGIIQSCIADEYEMTYNQAERFHQEDMKQKEKLAKEKARKAGLSHTKRGKKTTRYIARDKDGRVIGKEVIEE